MKTRTLRSPARAARVSRIRPRRTLPKAFAQLLETKTERSAPKKGTSPQPPEIAREHGRRVEPEHVEPTREPELSPRDPERLEAFSPLPSVVTTSPSAAPEISGVGTSWDRAQVAAMAERMLTSFRHGEVDGRDEVRMQLRALDAEVHVRVDDGRVVATLVGDGLEGLARTLERELQARGLHSEITISPE